MTKEQLIFLLRNGAGLDVARKAADEIERLTIDALFNRASSDEPEKP